MLVEYRIQIIIIGAQIPLQMRCHFSIGMIYTSRVVIAFPKFHRTWVRGEKYCTACEAQIRFDNSTKPVPLPRLINIEARKTYPEMDTEEKTESLTEWLGRTSSPNEVVKMVEQMREKRNPTLSATVLCTSTRTESITESTFLRIS